MTTPRKPRHKPCGSCPYRKDVPSGVWDESEYRKLPLFDKPTAEQPVGVFLCHSQDGSLCAGWAACHNKQEGGHELMSLRIGVAMGTTDPSAWEYTTDVPIFASGQEACDHGLQQVESPPKEANVLIAKLKRAQELRGDEDSDD